MVEYRQGQLPWLRPEDLTEEQRLFYDETVAQFDSPSRPYPLREPDGRLNGPYNPLLFAPDLGRALHRLGAALRFDGALPRDVFECIVLIVAVARHSEYEWFAHAPLARRAGVGEPTLDAIRNRRRDELAAFLGEDLYELVTATIADRSPRRADVKSLEQRIGFVGILEAVATVGHFTLIASVLRTWGIPAPADPPLGGSPSGLA